MNILICFQSNVKGDWSSAETLFPNDVLTAMAQGLLCADDGNVEFQAESWDGSTKSLYAHRQVLSTRCEHYKMGDSLSRQYL